MKNFLFENFGVIYVGLTFFGVASMFVCYRFFNTLKLRTSGYIVLSLYFSLTIFLSAGVLDVKINDEYRIKPAHGSEESFPGGKELYLYKKESDFKNKQVVSIDMGNGLKVEKGGPSKTDKNIVEYKVLKIQCGKLNYDECVKKIQDNFESILVAGSDNDGQAVVKF